MKIQVLVATMDQENITNLLESLNIQTEAIITNQTTLYSAESIDYKGNFIHIYNFNEKGVGLNRNNALMRADADIVLIADDDIEYMDNYKDMVIQEFKNNPNADMIVFNVCNEDNERKRYVITKNKRVHTYNCLRYGAVRFAIKLSKVKEKNIYFSLLFGGGAKYGSGEDSIFIYSCIKSGLKVYSSTKELVKIKKSNSTWFAGYNEKYFYDKGALLKSIFNRKAYIMILIFLLKNKETTKKIGMKKSYEAMKKGLKEFGGEKYATNNEKYK